MTAVAGRHFTFRVATSGYPVASLSHSPLPRGLRWAPSAHGGAFISGEADASAAGPTRVSLTAMNAQGSSRQVLTITVAAVPTITSGASMRARDGAAVSFTVRASGYPRPVLAHGALPDGLKWARDGGGSARISGRPNAASVGTHRVVITAKNSFGTARQLFTITVY